MAATGRVSHTGAGGPSASERLLSLGYPLAGDLSLGGFKSENITSGNEGMPAQEAVNRWMGDALHLNTMISADLTEIGAGVTANAGRVYFVIDAARPTDSGIPQDLGTSVAGVPTTVPGVSAVIIPVVVVTPNENGDIIHEVKAGQSLWQIAISYNTRIDEIKRLNNLFDNNIYPGSKLLIKKGVPTSTAPSVITESQAISTLTQPTAIASITVTPTKTIPAAAPPNNLSGSTIGIAIGIIALAILGGGVFAWWGTKKEE
ncbi:MAG TPA: LysM peptidoglycan-binding domain-containing protein, partial [Anaerolineales bacterium]|nr:LysM peptidoglycan-binding domain-containing protein [Anaerolineales bacterium]